MFIMSLVFSCVLYLLILKKSALIYCIFVGFFSLPHLNSFISCTIFPYIPIVSLSVLCYQCLYIFLHLLFLPALQCRFPLCLTPPPPPLIPLSSCMLVVTFVRYPGCLLPAVLLCDLTAALPRMGPFIRAKE